MPANSGEHDPFQLPLEAEGMPESPHDEARFDPAQRRAFGSVPGLLGRELTIPPFERLNAVALRRVEPDAIKSGLLGREGGYAVDTVVLNPEEYTTVVRSPRSFQRSVQAKTVAANRSANEIRAKEKEIRSGHHAFENKADRHVTYIESLVEERAMLEELLEWQRTPGFARTSQIDIVALANRAWNLTFRGMLDALKNHYDLTVEEHSNMTNAMAHKLFRGPQRDRIAYWGEMLAVARDYNRAKTILFTNRQHKIARRSGELAVQLDELYEKHGIS